MEIKIGDLVLGHDGYYLSSPLEGFEGADIRVGNGLWAGVDGGYVSTQLYGVRTLVISGFYVGSSCLSASELRDTMIWKLPIRRMLPIYINDFSGRRYYTEGYVTDFKSDIQNVRSGEYQITILCPDPRIYYGDSETGEVVWKEEEITGTSESPSLILNSGKVDVKPIITISGASFEKVKVGNSTSMKYIEIEHEIESTDELVIDMSDRTILLNGTSIASDRTIDSEWWDMLAGINQLYVERVGGSGTLSCVIKFKEGVRGI